jgi:hypothetical protein
MPSPRIAPRAVRAVAAELMPGYPDDCSAVDRQRAEEDARELLQLARRQGRRYRRREAELRTELRDLLTAVDRADRRAAA